MHASKLTKPNEKLRKHKRPNERLREIYDLLFLSIGTEQVNERKRRETPGGHSENGGATPSRMSGKCSCPPRAWNAILGTIWINTNPAWTHLGTILEPVGVFLAPSRAILAPAGVILAPSVLGSEIVAFLRDPHLENTNCQLLAGWNRKSPLFYEIFA